MEDVMDLLEEVAEYINHSNETVSVRDVLEMILETVDSYFDFIKKENKSLKQFAEVGEMTLTTSLTMNLGLLTKKRAYIEKKTKGFIDNDKPN